MICRILYVANTTGLPLAARRHPTEQTMTIYTWLNLFQYVLLAFTERKIPS